MSLRTRRIIMLSFILCFFILAPVLIFYASGYRLDFKRVKILRTGTLFIEAKNIDEGKLYINNQLKEKPFNEKEIIYNLIPGEYDIKLTKDNYYDWQKKITIHSSLTTFEQDIMMFSKNIPLQLIDGEISKFVVSPDSKTLVFLLQSEKFIELYSYNFKIKKQNLIYRIPNKPSEIKIDWAASSKKILVQINQDYLIFDIQNSKQNIVINNLLNFIPTNVIWDKNSDNLVYANNKSSISKLDLLAKTNELIFSLEDSLINPEFTVESNDIFYIVRENNNILYKYNTNFKTNKKILELNKSKNFHFITSTNNYISLIDSDLQKLYLIKKIITDAGVDIKKNDPIKIFSAKQAIWDNDENQLLICNDFELILYNIQTGEEQFINRYGQEIKDISWYPGLQYVLILFNNELEIIDRIQDNGQRNTIKIIKYDEIYNQFLNKKGDLIYFSGKIGKQQGLYQIEI